MQLETKTAYENKDACNQYSNVLETVKYLEESIKQSTTGIHLL